MRAGLLLLCLGVPLAAVEVQEVVLQRPGEPLRLRIDDGAVAIAQVHGWRIERAAAGGGRAAVARLAAGRRAAAVARWHGARQALILPQVIARIPRAAAAAELTRAGLRERWRPAWSSELVLADAPGADPLAGVDAAARLAAGGRWAEPLVLLPIARRAEPTDPLYAQQWHLRNTGSNASGAVAGVDIGILAHWTGGGPLRRGSGINLAVVDDGIDAAHPDLLAGVRSDLDYDYLESDGSPAHGTEADAGHGTVVAGLAAARADGAGTVGVAPEAGIVALRFLGDAGATSAGVAGALGHRAEATSDPIHVSNNSWGPSRDGTALIGLDPAIDAALTAGVAQGRGGRGTVYVFAAGNDFDDWEDRLDYNAYGGDRRVIAVAALGPDGAPAPYSEPGVGVLLAAPGGVAGAGMVGTDIVGSAGFASGDHTAQGDAVIGTSFAAPLVAGAAALLIEQQPLLSWRDVPHLLARSAVQLGGTLNGAGLRFDVRTGAGRLDVSAALALAATWTPLPPETSVTAQSSATALAIPDNAPGGVERSLAIAAPADLVVERAVLTVDATHTWRGDIAFELQSPAGTIARMGPRPLDDGNGLDDWSFASLHTLGEGAAGTWRVRAIDTEAGLTGTLGRVRLTLHGYRPYPAPVLTRVVPGFILVGQGDTTYAATGTVLPISQGGDAVGTAELAGHSARPARETDGWLATTVPAASVAGLVAGDTATFRLTAPQVPGPGGALAGGGSAEVVLPVRATNAAPVLASATDASVAAGASTSAGRAVFSDPDGDPLRYRIVSGPASGTAAIDAASGLLTYAAPALAAGTTATIQVAASDGLLSGPVTVISIAITAPVSGGTGGGGGGGGGGGCMAGSVAGLLAALALLLQAGKRPWQRSRRPLA